MSPSYESPEGGSNSLAPLGELLHWLASTTLHVALGILLGWGVARLMRSRQLSWTWAAAAFPAWLIVRPLFGGLGLDARRRCPGCRPPRSSLAARQPSRRAAIWRRSPAASSGRWTPCVPRGPGAPCGGCSAVEPRGSWEMSC